MNECPDVAVIGAGFAGLAAAYELLAHGISVEVLEAMSQYGYEQGLSPTKIDYMSFFHSEAAALPGT